jgi:two-component system, NtrC family, nitrogen regulation response regulator GlnG
LIQKTGTILVADDDAAIRTVVSQALTRAGYDVRTAGNAAALWRFVQSGDGDLIVTDVMMPDENAFDLIPRIRKLRPQIPIVVMSAQNTFMTAIKASERGAYEYLPKPFDLGELVGIVGRALAEPREVAEAPPEPDEIPLVGRSPAMQEIYRTLARLMHIDLTVLINGESGTGKELVARALHDFGKRSKGPFVAINMAAIPRDLIEAELFGHEKGAFTGASQRSVGRFEQAEGGTLFLDEIGDMPMEAQTRLLRVLQQGEYTTVGGRTPIKTNVRIVAATNKDLRGLIQTGLFREDLYFRLNVVPLRLPPLRERAADIPDLARHFFNLAEKEGLQRKQLDAGAIERMKAYPWPGNIRELENLIRRRTRPAGQPAGRARAPARRGRGRYDRRLHGRLSRAVFRVPRRWAARVGPLRPRAPRGRGTPRQRHAGGDARQPDQGGGASGPQPQHPAEEDPRPRHQGHPLHPLRRWPQKLDPGSLRNSASSGVVSRPSAAFRCGKRPNRAMMSRCRFAKSSGSAIPNPSISRTQSSWSARLSLCISGM